MNPAVPPTHSIPHYDGPRPTPPAAPRFGRRGRVLAGVAATAVVAAGAALVVARPWSPNGGSSAPFVLHHDTVEGGLFDDGAPRCNGGHDIPAVTGRRFVCTSATTVYVVEVSEADAAERRVGWEVVSERYR